MNNNEHKDRNSSDEKINLKKSIIKLVLSTILVCLILIPIYFLLKHYGLDDLTKEEIQQIIDKTGIYGKIVFILLSFLQVTIIPIPSTITILAGSVIFGFWEGFFLSFIGIMLGSLFAFFLGKTIGRKFVNWVVGSKEQVDYYLDKLRGKETVLLFFMFLFPLFPDDLLCSVAGLTKMTTSTFTIIQFITRPVGILGTLLFMSGEVIPYKGWGLVIIALVVIISIILFIYSLKYSERINDFFENISLKITKLFKNKKI